MTEAQKAVLEAAKAWHPEGECVGGFFLEAKELCYAIDAVRALEAAPIRTDLDFEAQAVERERKAFVGGWLDGMDEDCPLPTIHDAEAAASRRYPMPDEVLTHSGDAIHGDQWETGKPCTPFTPGKDHYTPKSEVSGTGCTCHFKTGPGGLASDFWLNPNCPVHSKPKIKSLHYCDSAKTVRGVWGDAISPHGQYRDGSSTGKPEAEEVMAPIDDSMWGQEQLAYLRVMAKRIRVPLLRRIEALERAKDGKA